MVPGDPDVVEPLESTSWKMRCIIVELFPLKKLKEKLKLCEACNSFDQSSNAVLLLN